MELYGTLSFEFSHINVQLKKIGVYSSEELSSLKISIRNIREEIKKLRNDILQNKPRTKDDLKEAFQNFFDTIENIYKLAKGYFKGLAIKYSKQLSIQYCN